MNVFIFCLQEAVASDFGKRMPREESAPAPKPTVDMRKIMERRDVTLDKLRHQVKSYPKVQGQLDRIKTGETTFFLDYFCYDKVFTVYTIEK